MRSNEMSLRANRFNALQQAVPVGEREAWAIWFAGVVTVKSSTIIAVVADKPRRHPMKMTRRHMFGAACAAAAMTLTRTALGGWEPSEAIPIQLSKAWIRASTDTASSTPVSSGSRPACAGAKGRRGSAMHARPIYAYDV